MLNIVICDDEKNLRSDLHHLVEVTLQLEGCDYRIQEYACAEDMLADSCPDEAQLFFLDIEMKQVDGMEAARRLRQRNRTAVIVFVTAYPDYVFQGYEVRAMNYILKPYKEEKIREILSQALKELEEASVLYYLIQQKSGTIRVDLREIRYFKSELRQVTAVTESGSYTFYEKLDEVAAQLPDTFVRVHNRYLVNLKFISAVNTQTVVCVEEELPLSRSNRDQTSAAFARYLLR